MILWYISRATGVVALLLLTLAVSLGLANAARLHSKRIPRFVVNSVHRNASLLAVVFAFLHVATVILDGYVPISVMTAVVPFSSSYKAVWLAFGTVSLDLFLAVLITSLLRKRIGNRVWRTVHWLAYLSWPDAVIHSVGIGTDAGSRWMLALTGGCVALVAAALAVRWRTRTSSAQPSARGQRQPAGHRAAANALNVNTRVGEHRQPQQSADKRQVGYDNQPATAGLDGRRRRYPEQGRRALEGQSATA
jgi:sulfoxide reductase heme-binding subunit YedZ